MKITFTTIIIFFSITAFADEVTIVDAKANKTANNTYSFSITLKHADSGWNHYADQWQVLTPDHKILATRTLLHPHIHEQPFTRSLGEVTVPAGTPTVIIRARDKVHGVSSQEFKLNLP